MTQQTFLAVASVASDAILATVAEAQGSVR
jgi:hypothetical protein